LIAAAVVFAVIAGSFSSARAQGQSPKVVDIQVKGNTYAAENLIKGVAGITIGDPVTGNQIQDAVKNLYALGIFEDITVEGDEVPGGIVLTFIVKEYPKLRSVRYIGNDKFDKKDLDEKTKLAPGGYVTDNLIQEARNAIEKAYYEKGYFLVGIQTELDYLPNDSTQADLVFRIKERHKVKVEKVILTGTKRLEADDLVGKMRNRKRGFLRSSDFKKEEYPQDKEKIIEYCRKKGFIDAYIKSDSFVIDSTRNRMKIYIELYEGPRYYFGDVNFVGNELFEDDILNDALKFKRGEIFNEEKFDESTAKLYELYHERGYLHARIFDDRQTVDTMVNITYNITEGLPSKVNLVEIVGNTKTKEKVIRREMLLRPGQTFRRSLMMRSLREIMQLNYFADIVPDIRDLPSGDVDVIVKVKEKPTGQVSAGAGYSGQDKLVGTFGLGIPNLFGNGQSLNFNLDFGSRRNSLSISFTEPWFMGTPTSVGVDLYNLNRRWYDDFTEGRRGGALRLGRRLKWPDNYFKLFLRYRLEDVRYHDFDEAYVQQSSNRVINSDGEVEYVPDEFSLLRFNERWLRTSAFSFTIERDSRDLPEFATRGSHIWYTGEFSGGILGGEWDYYKQEVVLQQFIPLPLTFALSGRAKFGHISAETEDDIPYSEKYAPGGTDRDGMIRGYDDGSLGPRENGVLVRGNSEVVYNLQLQFPLSRGQLYMLAFADAGTAWRSKDEIRPFSHLYKGAGVGFRLVVPGIGTIGFDFGYAFDKAYGQDKGWQPHFQIGQGL
jgi:outer membrane protein insertion porin family